MPVRPLTDDEKRARDAAFAEQPSDAATYGPGEGKATYRGQEIPREEAADADHHEPA